LKTAVVFKKINLPLDTPSACCGVIHSFPFMHCPLCEEKMIEVKTSSHYGIPILLDQCPHCGGLWFDEDELYRTRLGAAAEVEKEIDLASLSKTYMNSQAKLLCPRDRNPLTPLSPPHFYDRLEVKACPVCQGFWFKSGGFRAFQAERAKRIQSAKGRTPSPQDEGKNRIFDQKIKKQLMALMEYNATLELERERAEKEKEQNLNLLTTAAMIAWRLVRLLALKK